MKNNIQTLDTSRFAQFIRINLIFIFLVVKTATAQPGTLDTSFGANGKVIEEMFGQVYSTALQADGKILVGGVSASTGYPALARFNADGSNDEYFGENGKVLINLYSKYSLVYAETRAIAVQKDGKIIATGYGFSEDRSVADYFVVLLRYGSDGSLDPSFGDSGVVISDFEGGIEIGHDIAFQSDGKIVIAGQSKPNLLVARYNNDGSFDLTFGGTGWVKFSNSGKAFSVALQDDGKIVTEGINDDSNIGFMLVRFNTNGKPDSSFGVNGHVITDFGRNEFIKDIAIQADGRIVAAGKSYDDATGLENIALIRYQQDGTIDSSFGANGKVSTAIEGYNAEATTVLIDEINNKIIVSGSASDFVVIRYNKDGSLNDNFAETGIQITDFGEPAGGKDAVLQPDGKIIVAGTKGNEGLALARYNNNPEETPQITRIIKWLHRHGFSWDDFPRGNKGHFSIERSANGIAFNGIARLQRSGNQQHYSYEDPAPLNGTNYYRVSAVSEDGSSVQSNIITIENKAASIKVFPIPAKNNIQIEGLAATQKTKLSIIDYSGNVKAAVTVVNNGSYSWHIAQLKPGNYLLKIEAGNTVVTRKFTKE